MRAISCPSRTTKIDGGPRCPDSADKASDRPQEAGFRQFVEGEVVAQIVRQFVAEQPPVDPAAVAGRVLTYASGVERKVEFAHQPFEGCLEHFADANEIEPGHVVHRLDEVFIGEGANGDCR